MDRTLLTRTLQELGVSEPYPNRPAALQNLVSYIRTGNHSIGHNLSHRIQIFTRIRDALVGAIVLRRAYKKGGLPKHIPGSITFVTAKAIHYMDPVNQVRPLKLDCGFTAWVYFGLKYQTYVSLNDLVYESGELVWNPKAVAAWTKP
jgi:hypothetical protein